MWLKIVAGLAAALAVVTVGVYVAMPPSGGTCGQKCGGTPPVAETSEDLSADGGCCAGCCSKKAAVSTDALAACAGGMSAVAPTSTPAAKVRCCDE